MTDDQSNQLLFYKGFELSHVFDFALWQDYLIFATGNGLYVSKPGSNEIHCLMSELDLFFFSLCPVGDRMYIGTSAGLYWMDGERFAQCLAQSGLL